MSIPASIVAGPNTTNSMASRKYLIFHVIIFWLSSLPPIFCSLLYMVSFDYVNLISLNNIIFVILLPLFINLWYLLWIIDSLLVAKAILIIVNLVHKPREGYFPRNNSSIDYRFWTLRATIKKFPIWAAHNCPLPYLDIIAFKLFGVKVGFRTTLFDAFVDTEFIEIGDNTIIGQGSCIMSSMVTREWLIIKKVKLGSNVIIGGYSVVSPGSVIPDNVLLGVHSGTSINQELESDWIYMGVPCRKYKKNEYKSMDESDEELARKAQKYFKQYLDVDDLEEIETEIDKTRREKWTERRHGKKTEKIENLLEEEKILKKKIVEEIDEKLKERDIRKLERLQERINRQKNKKEKYAGRLDEIEKLRKEEEILKSMIKDEKDESMKVRVRKRLDKIRDRIAKEEENQSMINKEKTSIKDIRDESVHEN